MAGESESGVHEFKVGDEVSYCVSYGERLSGGVTTVIDCRFGTITKISGSNAVVNGHTKLPISKLRKVRQVNPPR